MELRRYMKRWAMGTGLRFLGVVILGLIMWLGREVLHPLAAGLGFLGVMIPLLGMELRQVR
jgi:hypothetical protein